MKNLVISVALILFIIPVHICDAENEDIVTIKKQFKSWQQTLSKEQFKKKKLFHIYFGKNYENNKWVTELDNHKEIFVGEEVTVVYHKKMGIKFNMTETSPSGDWHIYSEHYYWPSGNLFFIFWTMETAYADEPSTVERRLYFSKKGILIKSLESVYKTGTRIKIDKPNYMNKNIKYWLKIKDLPFYSFVVNPGNM